MENIKKISVTFHEFFGLDFLKNRIFGSFKLFSGAKIDFFAIFEIAKNVFLYF